MSSRQLSIFKCACCGAPLAPSGEKRRMRSDKRFCDRICRNNFNRWIARIGKTADRMIRDGAELTKYLDFASSEDTALSELTRVYKSLDSEALKRGVLIQRLTRG